MAMAGDGVKARLRSGVDWFEIQPRLSAVLLKRANGPLPPASNYLQHGQNDIANGL